MERSVSFTPAPDLYPFESRWFDSSVGKVHYVDEGKGRPILLLHGNPTWSFLYRNVIRPLTDRFRCVAPDYPGFGLSGRPPGYGYTPQEHAQVIGELIDQLDLNDLIVMGHDWGGPIGLSLASARVERVGGLVIGNTWLWMPEGRSVLFGRVMSSRPMQWAILKRNFFVERVLPSSVVRDLSEQEMEHYRAVQPTPEARVGIAELPRQLVAAGLWLDTLEEEVPRRLGDKRVLITWPMRDVGFPAKTFLPRVRDMFNDVEVVELAECKHFFQEDAPEEVAEAIRRRFG